MEEKKGFIAEFKEFIARGNVMDLAVGVIIGAAFQNIVNALLSSFITPLISVITGGAEKDEAGNLMLVGGQFEIRGVAFDYGTFISAILNFLIMALILFLMIRAVNKLSEASKKSVKLVKKKNDKGEEVVEEVVVEEPAAPSETDLLAEIRDLLKENADK